MRRPIGQKRSVVQYLTTLGSAPDRPGCHMPYICPDAGDSSPVRITLRHPNVPPFYVVPLFHCFAGWLFALCRNNLAIRWLAPPVHAPAAGHLLCRTAAREGVAENGREGDRQAAQAGLSDPP